MDETTVYSLSSMCLFLIFLFLPAGSYSQAWQWHFLRDCYKIQAILKDICLRTDFHWDNLKRHQYSFASHLLTGSLFFKNHLNWYTYFVYRYFATSKFSCCWKVAASIKQSTSLSPVPIAELKNQCLLLKFKQQPKNNNTDIAA